jgi:hypothetical protein
MWRCVEAPKQRSAGHSCGVPFAESVLGDTPLFIQGIVYVNLRERPRMRQGGRVTHAIARWYAPSRPEGTRTHRSAVCTGVGEGVSGATSGGVSPSGTDRRGAPLTRCHRARLRPARRTAPAVRPASSSPPARPRPATDMSGSRTCRIQYVAPSVASSHDMLCSARMATPYPSSSPE